MKRIIILALIAIPILILLLYLCLRPQGQVYDEMISKTYRNYEFVVFRTGERYFEAGGHIGKSVYLDYDSGEYPEMNDGEFALVTADVIRRNGGIVGYTDNLFIDDLISYKIIALDEAAERCGISKVGEERIDYYHPMLIHHFGDNVYLVFDDRVYLNGSFVGEYEDLYRVDDLAAFLENLS